MAGRAALAVKADTASAPRSILALGSAADPTAEGLAELVRELIIRKGLTAPTAAGTAGHFSEINRSRRSVLGADAVVWSTSPQVHETDDVAIMQAAAIVGQTVASAGQIWPELGAAVSCVRLAPPDADDPRAEGGFGAAWLVAVLAGLAGTRCAWVTVDLPIWTQRAGAAALTATTQVLRALREFRGLPLARAHLEHDTRLAVLAARQAGGARLLVAELAGQRTTQVLMPGVITRCVTVSGTRPEPRPVTGRAATLTLGPHEVVRASIGYTV